MIRRKFFSAALLSAAVLMTAAAFAPSANAAPVAGIVARIARQQQRINQGISNGSLTRREVSVLQYNLNRIKILAANMRARSGGVLIPRQRARLNRMLDRNSAMIFNKKHNPIRRF